MIVIMRRSFMVHAQGQSSGWKL